MRAGPPGMFHVKHSQLGPWADAVGSEFDRADGSAGRPTEVVPQDRSTNEGSIAARTCGSNGFSQRGTSRYSGGTTDGS